jgi:hypothetical protein
MTHTIRWEVCLLEKAVCLEEKEDKYKYRTR